MRMTLEARGELDFVLTLRRRWADVLYPALRAEYDATSAQATTPQRARPVVQALPTYPWFAWAERNAQKALWRAVQDAVAEAPPRALADGPATLTLDPDLTLPDWYPDWDIHIQPGWVWRNDASAATYELGAKLVMLGVTMATPSTAPSPTPR